ncbi:MAG: tRNA (adenosine(37)-N6)-threonylcarbamoyltransferase complex dimerization subunit type 1 TsaB [Deltaproteobacteria bacterium]|nr:tRNA (adenosine(37)-N6)-threonylcarbamoyltransferase complex dimerization subunit type 1 TsaB [Deltaproteobacteria bacterium]
MRVLAIDTSSDVGGITILSSNNEINRLGIGDSGKLAENIYSMIEKVLINSNINITCIDLFSAVLGPGSFTGLRVALSVIKAFAFSLNKPVYGIDTMRLMAHAAFKTRDTSRVFIVQNARRGEVFISLFDRSLKEIEGVRIISSAELLNVLKREKCPAVIREVELANLFPDPLEVICVERDLSLSCAELSLVALKEGLAPFLPSELEPIYVRNDVVRSKR